MTNYTALLFLSMAGSTAIAQDGTAPVDSQNQAGSQKSTSAITPEQRLGWILNSTLGAKNLTAGFFVAGLSTWRNEPPEYGPHGEGYGKRYGLRLTTGGTSNVIEAGLGSIWGEDPRYKRAAGQPVRRRVFNVFTAAFVTHDRNGEPMPAYARYIAVPGGNLVSNLWRPDSQATVADAFGRVGYGFLSRIIGNAFSEFFPDLRERAFRRKSSQGTSTTSAADR